MKWSYLIVVLIAFLLVGCAAEVVKEKNVTQQETKVNVSKQETVQPVENKTTETNIVGKATETVETGTTHTVDFILKGFSPKELTIKKGDTVVWRNTRDGRLNIAMVLGAQNCNNIKSKILETGETFSWTFNETQNCTFVDGITKAWTFELKVE